MNKIYFNYIIFIFIILIICLTGCSKETSKATSSISIEEHLKNVLLGKEKFKYSEQEYDGIKYSNDINVGLSFYIQEIPYIFTDNNINPISEYAIIDINQDSKNEIVANLNTPDNLVLILHRENNVNYGYILSSKSFNTLKENGQFLSCGFENNKTIHEIEFKNEIMNIKTIAYSDLDNFYNSNDEQISKEEFEKYLNNFSKNKDVKYIKFENTKNK